MIYTNGGAQAKHAVSPGISSCMCPETASSETPGIYKEQYSDFIFKNSFNVSRETNLSEGFLLNHAST